MFALELYRKLARTPGNLFCSPYSVSVALAMVAAGAAGRTRDELVSVLGDDPLAQHEALRGALAQRDRPTPNEAAMAKLTSPPPEFYGCILSIANALWHQRGYPVAEPFVAAMRDRLGAEVRDADFAGDTAGAVREVNAWAAHATRDRIREVLSTLSDRTRVLLANAVYFKARWSERFSKGRTRPLPFTTGTGARVDVPTMQVAAYFRYAKLSATEVIELPYTGGAIAMFVMLPTLGGLASFERVLDLDRVMTALASQHVTLTMPKFRVESSLMLGKILEELGIVDAFAPSADFTRVSSEPGFALSEVVHKTFVDVDENGTEAAAVTIPMLLGGGRPSDIVEMHVDRPFVFAIVDKPTSTILFMGRVEDPR